MIYCEQYASVQSIGSFVSKSFFLAVIIALKKVFTDDEIKELSVRYSIMLVLIPMGSIYIGVTKKMVVIYLYLTILVAELKSQLYVLAEGL